MFSLNWNTAISYVRRDGGVYVHNNFRKEKPLMINLNLGND